MRVFELAILVIKNLELLQNEKSRLAAGFSLLTNPSMNLVYINYNTYQIHSSSAVQ